MRLLVLDGSLVLRHVVERLVPSDVIVESAATFDEAWRVLAQRPPDAMIATLGPSDLPWRRIQRRCQESDPPIPVLFESCVYQTPQEAGLDAINRLSSFLSKPYPTSQLRSEIDRLLRLADPRSRARAGGT